MNTGPFSLAVLTVGAQQTYRTMKNHPRTPVTEKPEPSLGEGLGKQFRHYQIHFVSEVTAQTRGGPGSLSESDGLRQDLGLPWALTAVVVVVGSGKLHLSPVKRQAPVCQGQRDRARISPGAPPSSPWEEHNGRAAARSEPLRPPCLWHRPLLAYVLNQRARCLTSPAWGSSAVTKHSLRQSCSLSSHALPRG